MESRRTTANNRLRRLSFSVFLNRRGTRSRDAAGYPTNFRRSYMNVAIFNSGLFLARYPQFATAFAANPTIFSAYFTEAGILYLDNSPCARIPVPKRSLLLNMLVAHIAEINGLLSADGQFKPVGRMSQAAEGSVSASFEGVPPTPGTGAWFQQTQAGAAFWQATTNQRGFRYIANPTRF